MVTTIVVSILVLNLSCAIVSYFSGNWMMGFVAGCFLAGLALAF